MAAQNIERVEKLYKQTLLKKAKYKDRATKYKQLLRKRDKEIMDLIVEAKDTRQQLE